MIKCSFFLHYRWAFDPNVDILNPVDVTDEMLEKVADCVSVKQYNSKSGTTCHQCRQKTSDVKTVCRSGNCAGVRGMFCGVCLKNRYGQDVRQALKDPEWWCPPCKYLYYIYLVKNTLRVCTIQIFQFPCIW